jgi:hypothetical protein
MLTLAGGVNCDMTCVRTLHYGFAIIDPYFLHAWLSMPLDPYPHAPFPEFA